MTLDDGVQHHVFGNLVRACLDHRDLFLRAGEGYVHVALLALPGVGVDHHFAVDEAEHHAADRSVERNVGNGNGRGSTDHGRDLRRIVLVNGENRVDDRDVVSEVLREQRPDRSVDNAGRENRLLGGLALSLEESAGDLAYGVQFFLIVYAEREKVDSVSGRLGRCRGRNDHRVAVTNQDRAVGQLGHLAGFNRERSAR